jgi:hypothetical protein
MGLSMWVPIIMAGTESKVRLMKVGVEGHKLAALMGVVETTEANMPALIIVPNNNDATCFRASMGY